MADATHLVVEFSPETRLDLVDVAQHLQKHASDALASFEKLLFCSMHTTAGYLDQSLVEQMQHRKESVADLVRATQRLFPVGAPYWHDRMNLRSELSEAQKELEPHNADSHLAYIGLGLENCVAYDNRSDLPVYFIDLDGVNNGTPRSRRTMVVGYNKSESVAETVLDIPVSDLHIQSVKLDDPALGLMEMLEELLTKHEIQYGTIRLTLDPDESHAGLTVNEYEPLLVRNDLAGVLRNPLRYMREKAAGIIRDPLSLPSKARHYVRHDLVQIINEVRSTIGHNASLLECVIKRFGIRVALLDAVIDRVATIPAPRWLRVGRQAALLIADHTNTGTMVCGVYQSPILIQWRRPRNSRRRIRVSIERLSG